MKTKLSPYTIASNCTDLTDIRDGINEIQERNENACFRRNKCSVILLLQVVKTPDKEEKI